MAEPFIGEIKLFPWNWAPRGWALCDGQILSIAQNTTLFALLGTMYGGNGTSTFALPDMRGRTPIHTGPNYSQGEIDGIETVTITLATLPSHTHEFRGTSMAANARSPNTNYLANVSPDTNFGYATSTTPIGLNPESCMKIGGNQPHQNMQPFLVLNYCIALFGVFPSRN